MADDYTYVAPVSVVTVDSCDPVSAPRNARLTVTVFGSGFQDGATVDFEEKISVREVTVFSDKLEVRIKVHKKAILGSRNVTVTNLGGLSGTKAGCFTVT